MASKAIVLVSGGMDSCVTAAIADRGQPSSLWRGIRRGPDRRQQPVPAGCALTGRDRHLAAVGRGAVGRWSDPLRPDTVVGVVRRHDRREESCD